MVQIGKINRLPIKGMQKYGIHLDGGESGDILLKGRYDAGKYHPGDEIDVFVSVDKEQRLFATTLKPYAMVDDFSFLRVVTTTDAGAFLAWGLESDLFVPKSEQKENMQEGQSYVVFLYVNETNNRIAASSKLKKFLNQRPPEYKKGEEVDLIVYAETKLGYSTVVNNSHVGVLYKNEVFQKLVVGQQLKGYINKIRQDMKLDLRLQQTGYQRVDDISQSILDTLKKSGGMIAVTDKSPTEDIYTLFGVSKKVFKKAVGALYKKRLIVIKPDGISLTDINTNRK